MAACETSEAYEPYGAYEAEYTVESVGNTCW
jgi:hypothetical protein